MRRAAYLIILGLGLIRVLVGARLGFRPFDDTYITFRYALNLASGWGFVYNLGEPVLGTTSPLWAVVLAGLRLAHLPLESGSLFLSLAMDVATAILLFRVLLALDYDISVGLTAAIVFLCWLDYFSLARSGMETACFVFLVVATIEAIVSERFARAGPWSALACLVRPEGLLLLGLLAFAVWQARSRVRRADLLAGFGWLLLIVGGWAIYAVHIFGSVIPQSVMAKAATAGDAGLRRFSWINLALFFLKGQYGGDIFARTYLQLMPIVSFLSAIAAGTMIGALRQTFSERDLKRAVALLVFPVSYVAGLALSHAFTFFPWYYGPIYPFAAMLAMIGASVLGRGRRPVVVGACALLVGGQLAAAWVVKWPNDRNFWVEGYFEVSDVVPRDRRVSVAAPEIGAVGWRVWPARVLDLEGLVTPAAVGVPAEEYVRSMKPDYLILRTDNARDLLARARPAPWFAQGYDLIAVRRHPYVDVEFRTYRIRR